MIDIVPSGIRGTLCLPPSKSQTLRAILFASIADGGSQIENYLDSPDTDAMIAACQLLGASFIQHDRCLTVKPTDAMPREVSINAQNSGIVLRFCAAVALLTCAKVTMTGDESCQTRRVCTPLLDGLRQLGAICHSNNGHAPFTICGPIHAGKVQIDGQDSQPVSALMIAASRLNGCTEIEIKNAGERPWLNMTLDWLKRLGVRYEAGENDTYRIWGQEKLPAFHSTISADLSTLAFPLAAALLTESDLVIEQINLDDVQGDKEIVQIFEKMGAKFLFGKNSIIIKGTQRLHGIDIDVNTCIDALPILAVVGCFAKGKTHLYNGAVARKKESDRIASIAKELAKMGANIEERPDGLLITESHLSGAKLFAHADHRLAMALTVAALAAKTPSTLQGGQCVKKTYSNFFTEFQRLGGRLS